MDQPDFVTEEHLEYLDNLRESGITNMFGAAPYLEFSFDLDKVCYKKDKNLISMLFSIFNLFKEFSSKFWYI